MLSTSSASVEQSGHLACFVCTLQSGGSAKLLISSLPLCSLIRIAEIVAVGLPCFTGTTAIMSHGSVTLAGIESVTDYGCNTQSLCTGEATRENTV